MMQRILVIGSQGYIGGTVCALAEQQMIEVQPVTSSDFDFWDVRHWPHWNEMRADAAIIAASVEHRVAPFRAKAETKPDKSTDELREQFCRLLRTLKIRRALFLSTDAVFDGTRGSYVEHDPVSPVTANARAKVAMEEATRAFRSVHVVRMSLVYGEGATKKDPRHERLLLQTSLGKKVHVPDTVFRSPIAVGEVATSVLRLALMPSDPPSIVHLAAPRRSLYDTYRECVIPERADKIHLQEGETVHEDTSLQTLDVSWNTSL